MDLVLKKNGVSLVYNFLKGMIQFYLLFFLSLSLSFFIIHLEDGWNLIYLRGVNLIARPIFLRPNSPRSNP